MNCPHCNHDTKVVDTRPIPEGVKRRRECSRCGRFNTVEKLAGEPVKRRKPRVRVAKVKIKDTALVRELIARGVI